MAKFLTDEWFSEVDRLTNDAGDLNLPPALADMILNINVANTSGDDTQVSLVGGRITKGANDDAQTTLNLDADVLKKVFLEYDMSAAMEAFMTGKIRVDGDMSKLMALQTAQPSAEQKSLFKNILAMTQA